jgi:pimeloyl-ACP methyl ester carboxylesterase
MEKKITFIPGWMYSADYFTLGEKINFWRDGFDFDRPIESDYLIGHSMGAAVALKLWSLNQETKIILINPFVERKNIFRTIIDGMKFYFKEGVNDSAGFLGLKYLPKNIARVFRFPDENYWEILKSIPKEKIRILHGANDYFLCDNGVCDKFRNLGLEVMEIPEAGHDWHKNFDSAILEIVNS